MNCNCISSLFQVVMNIHSVKQLFFLQYLGSISSCSSESLESSDVNATTKRRKICTGEKNEGCVNSAESNTTSNDCAEDGGNFIDNMTFPFGFSVRILLAMFLQYF